MVQAGKDASWSSLSGGFPGASSWEEADSKPRRADTNDGLMIVLPF